jgi:hypothetical protein
MSKVKCFVCNKFMNYVGNFSNRKKKKSDTAARAEEADFQK